MAQKIVPPKKPSLIDGKSVESILLNDPITREIAPGLSMEFVAMNDEKLMRCAEALERIVAVLQTAISLDSMMESVAAIIAAAPLVVRVALPEVTQLISVALGITVAQASEIKLARKIGILQGILEAEDIPLLIKNGQGLVSTFAGLPTLDDPAPTETITAAPSESTSSTEAPTTN